jgi:hypothetical protein
MDSGGSDLIDDFIEDLPALDCAGPCDDLNLEAADLKAANIHNAVFSLEFPADQLVRFQDWQDLLHSWKGLHRDFRKNPFISNRAYDGPLLTFGNMCPKAHVLKAPHNSQQVFFLVIRPHYNDHGDSSPYFFGSNQIKKP